MAKPEVGKTYDINHTRKGNFRGKVLKVDDEWIDVEIVKGKARNMASAHAEIGDVVTIRGVHSTFLGPV